jgi:riboflavin kinase/FMN adenylyltransferase
MQVVRGVTGLSSRHQGCVLTVGNYDGMHLGHQAIFRLVRERAAHLGCSSMVMAFEPSFSEFMDAANAPPRLMRWREKCLALAANKVDYFLTMRFDERLRRCSPETFERRVLVDALHVRHIVVGNDFRYGSHASGTVDRLCEAGRSHGFGMEQAPTIEVAGRRVSSTWIRECLAGADYDGAELLLGSRYRMLGKVQKGPGLGRTFGFPTANLQLKRKSSPVNGIIAVRIRGIGSGVMLGVASIGTRPTVNGVEPLLEVHVFDYSGDLYGRRLEVEFVHKLRDEDKFASLDTLVDQMRIDAAQARAALA